MFKSLLSLLVSLIFAVAAQAQSSLFHQPLPGMRPEVGRAAAAARPAASQLQEALVQDFDNGNWNDVARNVYLRYSGPLQPSRVRTDLRQGTAWVPLFLNRLRYNSAGLVLTDSLDQLQLPPTGPFSAQVNTYTTPTRLLWEWSLVRNILLPATAPWDSVERSTHTYNAAGQVAQILQQSYAARVYTNVLRQLFTYNAQNKLSVLETQTPAATAGAWQPDARSTYTYNAAGFEQQIVNETADNPTRTYVNESRETLQYNAQNRVTVITTDEWQANAWQVESQALYAYNALGDVVSITIQEWNGTAFVNSQRVLFNYLQVASVRGAAAWRKLAVAPNPSYSETPARLLLEPGTDALTGAIYDQVGRRVATLAATAGQARRGYMELPTELPAGLYVVRLHNATQQWQARWNKL